MNRIEILKRDQSERIYHFLARQPKALLYCSPRYVALVSDYLQADYFWLALCKDCKLTALLPVMVATGKFGPVYNSLAYYGSNGGVIDSADSFSNKQILIDQFYCLAEEAGACSATIITNPLNEDTQIYDEITKCDYKDQRVGQITSLEGIVDEQSLLAKFESPRPRNIRKAIKSGVQVSQSVKPEAIDALYAIHVENMQKIGGLAKEKAFFDRLTVYMQQGDWAIFEARVGGDISASLLVFYFNQTVEYFTPVVKQEFRDTQSLSLVIFEAMLDAVKRGFKKWNWGGTWLTQDGVYQFKKKWGTTDYPYFYYTKVFNEAVLATSREELLGEYKGFFVLPFSVLSRDV
ncbi:MAG: peptidoglycan bridge formation glycyltransferase FemA/FemB family protein [Pseudomonadota bacterium]|uniref:Peptidoglycan bridge formation glycyltransferase FemA/FemB family protein n=1 Tax=Alteromonas oceani TaxID=2071609 RepID=A0ABV7JU80_9ALTE|nr:peptidoglycan bridge formation glycyltransferase FemA/FemB family protein [Alteromonas oceani]MEC9261994.1 peptidoglycan bridge formation glycyltransferase FemA/FemB family protein [Pseudomonadota bacterium]